MTRARRVHDIGCDVLGADEATALALQQRSQPAPASGGSGGIVTAAVAIVGALILWPIVSKWIS